VTSFLPIEAYATGGSALWTPSVELDSANPCDRSPGASEQIPHPGASGGVAVAVAGLSALVEAEVVGGDRLGGEAEVFGKLGAGGRGAEMIDAVVGVGVAAPAEGGGGPTAGAARPAPAPRTSS